MVERQARSFARADIDGYELNDLKMKKKKQDVISRSQNRYIDNMAYFSNLVPVNTSFRTKEIRLPILFWKREKH